MADTPDSSAGAAHPVPDWEAFYRDYRKPGYVEGFEITSKLGGGMFGLVFRARRMSIGKDYAIKFLKVDDAEVRRAIVSELSQVQWFAQIDHPNLVAIEDRGEVDGIPYLVMAFAGSETLRDRMPVDADGNGVRPTPEQKAELMSCFLQCCRGLSALHERGLVHFDLKPANVFLKGSVARLGDYGLSKLVTHSRGSLSMGRGTPYYMAPEMLQRRGDHRSDVYSLGVVLYELLCGAVPFRGDSEWAVLRAHEAAEPDWPPHLTQVERAVLQRCLAKDPGQRFQSVQDLIVALGASLGSAVAPSAAPSITPQDAAPPTLPIEPPPLPGCVVPPLPKRIDPDAQRRARAAVAAVASGATSDAAMRGVASDGPGEAAASDAPWPVRAGRARAVRPARSSHRWLWTAIGLAVVFLAVPVIGMLALMPAEVVHRADARPDRRPAAARRDVRGDVDYTVARALAAGRRAAEQNRMPELEKLTLAAWNVAEAEVCRAMLTPLREAPVFVPALAERFARLGRPAVACAIEMLQELDYSDGADCRRAENLQRFLALVTGVEALTLELAGREPAPNERCLFAAAASAWRTLGERYVADEAQFERLLRGMGRWVEAAATSEQGQSVWR
ncbi:MAG: serine/threonine-protein kinase [Planctomycetota bacterium]